MFRSYRIGSIFGFPIEINLSFLLLLGIVLFTMGGLNGVFLVLVAFASVLLHELGHALVARHLGVHIAGIELSFFGGAAKMANLPRSASDEVAIAAAGPAVSFALAGSGFVLGSLTTASFFFMFGWLNIVIALFNLFPALPMDGGRILRALLTRRHSFVRATDLSVTITRGFAIFLGIVGIASWSLFMPILAVLLWMMGSAEKRLARFLSGEFSYDSQGYRRHAYGSYAYAEPIDLPRATWSPGSSSSGVRAGASKNPLFSFHRPVASSGFVVRQRNGRLVIELVK